MMHFYVFLAALILSLFLTFLAKHFAYKLNLFDKPGFRKLHFDSIPLTGGEAVYLSFVAGILIFAPKDREILSILLFGLVFILFGFIDDKGIRIRARYKIWSHLLFSLLFLYFSGVHFNFFRYEWLNYILSAGFITFMTNSMNMLDGMDGLVSGVSFLSAGFFCLLALSSRQTEIVFLALALMGAILGFLKYNFNPASIFLGEAGSTFLGFMLAIFAIKLNIYSLWDIALSLGIERLQIISFIVPLIILGIPIFDTYFVFANRFLNQIKFSQPGKDHTHHRIHLRGFSQKATVLTLYAVQIVLGAIALSMLNASIQQFIAMLGIVVVMIVFAWNFLTRVEVYS